MKVAFFSDMHNNIDNLKVFLDSVSYFNVDKIICLGDIFDVNNLELSSEVAAEVIALFKVNQIDCVYGNHDLYFRDNFEKYAKRYGYSSEVLEFLMQLPFDITYEFNSRIVKVVHASNFDVDLRLYPDSDELIYEARYFEDILIYGHTHIFDVSEVDDKLLICPGSITYAREGSLSYIIIEFGEELVINKVNL